MSIATAGALCILGRVNFLNLQSTVHAASERGSIAEFCTLTMLVSAARQIDRWDMFEAENPTYLERLSERKRPAGHIWMLMIRLWFRYLDFDQDTGCSVSLGLWAESWAEKYGQISKGLALWGATNSWQRIVLPWHENRTTYHWLMHLVSNESFVTGCTFCLLHRMQSEVWNQ